jgi:hypothetical protein
MPTMPRTVPDRARGWGNPERTGHCPSLRRPPHNFLGGYLASTDIWRLARLGIRPRSGAPRQNPPRRMRVRPTGGFLP